MGLMNCRNAACMSCESEMLTEACLRNYRHGRRKSGEQKTFEIEARQQHIDIIGACQFEFQNVKTETG